MSNTGIDNSGDWNSGNRNSGDWNSGNRNSGNRNSGNRNSGDWNSGNRNSGDWNSGDWNSGDWNSGNRNSGDWNSGNWNSGDWNSGNWNSGDCNSGDWNSGDWNSGDWNSGNRNSGYFCTDEPPVRMFNRDTNADRGGIEWPDFFFFRLTRYVWGHEMTDEEKADHPEYKTTGGYLQTLGYKEAWRKAWDEADDEDRRKVLDLPNFDADIFHEITGIDVREEFADAEATISVGGRDYRVSDVEKALGSIKPVG